MNETQNRTAAETVDDWCHRHGYDLMDVYEAHSLLAALAEGGYTIAGPGQVVVDRGLFARPTTAVEPTEWFEPDGLDLVPTQEGE